MTQDDLSSKSRQNIESSPQDLSDLQKTEKIWEGILASSPDAIVVIREDGYIEILNPIAAAHFSMSETDARGGNYYALLSPEIRSARQERIQAVLASGKPAQWEDSWSGLSFLNAAYPVKDGHRVVITSKDITEQKRAEERYMMESGYPELLWHVGLHLEFIKKVFSMSEEVTLKGPVIKQEILLRDVMVYQSRPWSRQKIYAVSC